MERKKKVITVICVLAILNTTFGCAQLRSLNIVENQYGVSEKRIKIDEEDLSNQVEDNTEIIQWVDEVNLGSNYCAINAEIGVKRTGKTVQAELDPFTTEEIQKYLDYFVSEQKIIVEENNVYTGEILLEKGTGILLQYSPNVFSINMNSDTIVQLEKWVMRGNAYPGEPAGTTLNSIEITVEEAITAGNNILNDLRISNCKISNVSKARLLDEKNNTKSEGWYISYVLAMDDMKPFDTAYTTGCGDMMFLDDKANNCLWPQQRVDMYVDQDGLGFFRFASRVVLSNYEENALLLPIQDIKQSIIENLKEGYKHFNMSSKEDAPYISTIFLSSCLCSSKLFQEKLMMVPVWIALISNKYYDDNHLDPFFIAINALDGQRINLIS